ncbi:MAG: FKBP-type peptidyl-prolyl cis-trans isomerase [Bacteroidales bacterium]|nr:FKBP-type peptidyl-prolyl cis-trans isomerase [Bacteroidales bacterium]
MRRALYISAAAVAICLLAVSCGKEALKTTYGNQEKYIETIAESLQKDGTATLTRNGGSVRVTVTEGEGEELREGGAVSFYYAGYFLNSGSLSNSNVFATNYDTFAKSIGWAVSDSTAFAVQIIDLAEDELVEGLRNGLIGVKGGEECYVLFSGKYGFGSKIVGTIPRNAALAYHLWIKSVSNN